MDRRTRTIAVNMRDMILFPALHKVSQSIVRWHIYTKNVLVMCCELLATYVMPREQNTYEWHSAASLDAWQYLHRGGLFDLRRVMYVY